MEKNLNLFTMRVKEWYAWHFPELTKLVSDNKTYIHCVKLIRVITKPFISYVSLG